MFWRRRGYLISNGIKRRHVKPQPPPLLGDKKNTSTSTPATFPLMPILLLAEYSYRMNKFIECKIYSILSVGKDKDITRF
jgi:hypothetical protein